MFCINDYPNTEIGKYDRISKFLSEFYEDKSEFEKLTFSSLAYLKFTFLKHMSDKSSPHKSTCSKLFPCLYIVSAVLEFIFI